MTVKDPTSHKTRSFNVGKGVTAQGGVEGVCAHCGAPSPRKYCGLPCYRAVQRSVDPVARFWAKVQRGPGCWLWTGSRTGGRGGKRYGQFTYTVDGKQVHIGAHVYAYELAHGPVPDGLEVMHSCNTGVCCRGSHLSAGTHRKNVQDAGRDGLLNVPHPSRHKLTDEQLAEMVELRRSGLLLTEIAARFDVTDAYVSLAVRGLRRQYREPRLVRRSA